MEKSNKKMILNKETAMRIWIKQFGKSTKAVDFSGRTIAKGAYNDRNSDYGWNVDHILPESKGGVTADHNLLCCHIFTNDEKADKFPCFTANNQKFEIVKVQNHYEIRKVKKHNKTKDDVILPEEGDFFDSAYGIRRIKKFISRNNKTIKLFSILIKLKNVKNTALFDFIEDMFDDEVITSCEYNQKNPNINYLDNKQHDVSKINIICNNILSKDNMQYLLDKCILLNTYLSNYFMELNYIEAYDIYVKYFEFENKESYYQFNNINIDDDYSTFKNTIYICDDIVENIGHKVNNQKTNQSIIQIINAGAKIKWHEYDYIFTNLAKNLIKEANRK